MRRKEAENSKMVKPLTVVLSSFSTAGKEAVGGDAVVLRSVMLLFCVPTRPAQHDVVIIDANTNNKEPNNNKQF